MLFDDNYTFTNYTNNNNLCNKDEGFIKGNMFLNEYIPYKSYKQTLLKAKNDKEKKLHEIMIYEFAIVDLGLFLDLNPYNYVIKNEFDKLTSEYKIKKEDYEKIYGPLTLDETGKKNFNWIDDPWPWQEGEDKYV